jgi:hypothetical protein
LGEALGHIRLVLSDEAPIFKGVRGGASSYAHPRKSMIIRRDIACGCLRKGRYSLMATLTQLGGITLVVGANAEVHFLDSGRVGAKPVDQVTRGVDGDLVGGAVYG